ncbi:phosphoribosyltransferase family protein [Porphyromonadaceae bacterium W3.11]|nr:phosphoribosyltransferase family protein [Porphyromonadaceae bacterium W3.11]
MSIGMINDLISFFFPSYCIHCAERLPADRKLICEECFDLLPKYRGHEAYYAPEERINGLIPFTELQSDLIFTRTNTTRKIIHKIKYHNTPDVAYHLSRSFALEHKRSGHFSDVSAIVPVPLAPYRMKKRGYNQSEFIAKGLAEVYGLPIEKDFLKRENSKTGTQTSRGKEERWREIYGAFYVSEDQDLKGRRILVVDDVLTTGATIVNAGRALLGAGAEAVSFYTLALDILL